MKTFLALLALFSLAAAIDPIVIRNNKFFNSVTGDQFYVVGIDYAPTKSKPDALSDLTALNRDIARWKTMNINTIRVYSLIANISHADGLKALSDAGIYVVLDVTDPAFSIVPTKPEWNLDIFLPIQRKIEPFLGNPVVLAFLCGNEVISAENQTIAAPFIKAAVRDVKAFIKSKGFSTPVGYAATDKSTYNVPLQAYLDCNTRESSVDFYGLNTYRGCGNDSYQSSGFQTLGSEVGNYGAPYILTEYGCNAVRPRTFKAVEYIYAAPLTDFLSGGFVYEWTEEGRLYGLVTVDDNGGITEVANEYQNFKTEITAINPPRAKLADQPAQTNTLAACPAYDATNFMVAPGAYPPAANQTTCDCMYKSLSCVVLPNADAASLAQTLGYICGDYANGAAVCKPTTTDPKTGYYGEWTGCNSAQRASYILHAYYLDTKKAPNSCNAEGNALLQTPDNSCYTASATSSTSQNTVTPTTGNGNNNGGNDNGTPTTSTNGGNNGGDNGNNGGNTNGQGSNDSGKIIPAVMAVAALAGVMAL